MFHDARRHARYTYPRRITIDIDGRVWHEYAQHGDRQEAPNLGDWGKRRPGVRAIIGTFGVQHLLSDLVDMAEGFEEEGNDDDAE